MCNRAIKTEIKVKALEQCLTLQNVEQVAAEVGVAPNSIRNLVRQQGVAGVAGGLGQRDAWAQAE